jgi:hypothetical protein
MDMKVLALFSIKAEEETFELANIRIDVSNNVKVMIVRITILKEL